MYLWRRPNVWSFLVNQRLERLWILKWVATNSLTLKKEKLSPKNMISFESFLSTYCCFSWSFILSSLYYMCVLIYYLNQWEQRHNNPWVKMEHLMIESITDCLYVNCIISKKTATKDHNKNQSYNTSNEVNTAYIRSSSSIWTYRNLKFEYLFWFFPPCLPVKNNKYSILKIQNSKFDKSKSMSYRGH